MVTTIKETTHKYRAEGVQDEAWKTSSSPNATVIVHSGESVTRGGGTLTIVGGRERFMALRDLLDRLLVDWE